MTKRTFIGFISIAFAAIYIVFSIQALAMDWVINSYRFGPTAIPIALVGSASNSTETGASVTVTMPGGVIAGDVVYAIVCSDTNASDQNMSITTPAGYTELIDIFQTDTNAANLAVFRKVQGGSPDTSVTFSGTGNSGWSMVGILYVLRNVNATPEDATTQTATGASAAAPDSPSITTVSANAWVLAVGCSTEPDSTPTAPTNYSDLVELQDTAGGRPASAMVARRTITAAGAENPAAFGGVAGDTSDSWAAASVAVKPE